MLLSEIQTYTLTHKANIPFSSAASAENSFSFITEKGIDILQVVRSGWLWWLTCFLLVISLNTVSADDATSQVFGDRTDGLPAAFGDFNSDELTDMFVLQDTGRTLQILLGSDKEPTMYPAPSLVCKFNSALSSVVPGDFNGDALMDVMVTSRDNDLNRIIILWGEMTKINCSENVLFKTKGQPLAIDYNKDMIIDLFGRDENGTRSFWLFNQNGTFVKKEMQLENEFKSNIRMPHSNAFLDLNNDDLADLYITTVDNFEIWLGNKEDSEGYTPWKTIPLPISKNTNYLIGQTVFLDVELKGELNHVLPVCFDELCTDSKIFVWSNNTWHDLQVDFKEPGTSNVWQFPTSKTSKNHPYLETITLRPGDFNMDGYPDIMVTLILKSGGVKSAFLENVPCKSSACNRFSRTFEVQWTRFGSFNNNTVLGVFYDFHQDGVLDIIFVHNKGSMYNVSAFVNPDKYDANFVKVMVVTGLTNPTHPLIAGPLRKSASVYGTNLPGPKVFYETTTQEGDPRKAVATQIPQSAHFSLNLPYVIFGLGRTPNFIDTLTVQVYGKDRQWTQLIPNSQMVVIPYPIREPYSWKVQLFVTPSKLIVQSVLALLATCIVISFIIAALYWKERKEDHLERLQEAHRFHFDAM